MVCAELFDSVSLGGGWWEMVEVLAHLGSGLLAENLSSSGGDQLVDLGSHRSLSLQSAPGAAVSREFAGDVLLHPHRLGLGEDASG